MTIAYKPTISPLGPCLGKDYSQSKDQTTNGNQSVPIFISVGVVMSIHCRSDQLSKQSAQVDRHEHIDADNGTCWSQFLRKSMYPCDLDGRHKVHVDLNIVINEAFCEHDPLLGFSLQIFYLREEIHYVKSQMKDKTDRCEEKWWTKAHTLLEDKI